MAQPTNSPFTSLGVTPAFALEPSSLKCMQSGIFTIACVFFSVVGIPPFGEAAPCAARYLTENGSRVVILQKEGKILGGGPSVSVHDYIERQSCRRLSVAVDKRIEERPFRCQLRERSLLSVGSHVD